MKLTKEELTQIGALGYKEDFTPEQLAGKHIDGVDGLVFETEDQYLDHQNLTTGFTPREVEHQDALTDGTFSKQAETALERGATK